MAHSSSTTRTRPKTGASTTARPKTSMAGCCPGRCPWASATLASSTRTGPETAAKNTGVCVHI
ncbi:unnamed protein product [Ixodes pacificus]